MTIHPHPMIGIVSNPKTNKGKSVERMEHVLSLLDEKGVEYDYRETAGRGDATAIADELSGSCDIIVAAGGDGTVFEVVNGVVGKDVRLFILPFGSGNDVSRNLGLYKRSDEELVDILLAGKTTKFDCGIKDGSVAFCVFVSFGIVTHIISEFEKKQKGSSIGYYSTMLKAIRSFRSQRFKVKTEGYDKEVLSDFVSVQSIRNAGAGMMIQPDAVIDDGYHDLVIVEHRGRFRKFCNLIALLRGKLPEQPNVYTERVKWAEIQSCEGEVTYSIDGELLTTSEVKTEVCDRPLTFICR